MSEQSVGENIRAAHVTGKYNIVTAIIAAIALIAAAVIGYYASALQTINITLQEQNSELQEQNEALVVEMQEDSSTADDTISALQKRINTIESEAAKLREDYSTLQDDYLAALNEIERLTAEMNQISSETKDTPVDSSSNDESSVQALNFIEVLHPYESYRYSTPNTMSMMGNTYSNGFQLDFEYSGYALFNLDGEYETLEFDMGHIDGSSMQSISFNIYLDGKFAKTIEANPEMRVTHISISLNHALQMKIEFGSHYQHPKYGFANAKIS